MRYISAIGQVGWQMGVEMKQGEGKEAGGDVTRIDRKGKRKS